MDDVGALALAGLAVAVLAGAGTQRVTGLGFALVSSPFLVLLLGPFEGVLLSNVLGAAASLVVWAQTWRATQVRRLVLLALPAVVAVAPGAWVARELPAAVLSVLVGSLVLVALALVLAIRPRGGDGGWPGGVLAGAASGFMNVTAGVGGPAVTVYAMAIRWPHAPFVATVQLHLVLVNAASLTLKGWPRLPAAVWLVAAVALLAGVVAGHLLARRVPPQRARTAVVALAVVGAAAAVVDGVLAL